MIISEENYNYVIEKLRQKLQPLSTERIMFVDINSNGIPNHFITMAKGVENECNVTKSKIISNINTYNPSAIIMSHNHPRNTPIPSVSDNEITKWVSDICKASKVKLIDHVIILKDYDEYFSYRSNDHYSELGGIWRRKKKK